jgi:chemotaxis response regulator CheB
MVDENKPDPGSIPNELGTPEVARPLQAERPAGKRESETRECEAVKIEEGEAREEVRPKEELGCFVVGIGASAGGLEALEQLLKNFEDTDAAIVVIQHLSPHYASALTQLLARNSKIEIVTAADGTLLEGKHIYVIPPNADLSLFHGVLQITPPPPGPHFPIDHFLRSLSEDQGQNGIGVVLSGTGSDGTFGLKVARQTPWFFFPSSRMGLLVRTRHEPPEARQNVQAGTDS